MTVIEKLPNGDIHFNPLLLLLVLYVLVTVVSLAWHSGKGLRDMLERVKDSGAKTPRSPVNRPAKEEVGE